MEEPGGKHLHVIENVLKMLGKCVENVSTMFYKESLAFPYL
jgi:hypothetical protein